MFFSLFLLYVTVLDSFNSCLLYTSDAADERSSVDLGGRRIIKKKIYTAVIHCLHLNEQNYQSHYVSHA